MDTPPDDGRFTCPLCGGHWFGTSGSSADRLDCSDGTGHCHDQFGKGCSFQWPRSEDAKYFGPEKKQ